jgi:hypothetical protein
MVMNKTVIVCNCFAEAPEICTEYTCKDGGCISMSLVCNEEQNCLDGSDEGGQCGKYNAQYK